MDGIIIRPYAPQDFEAAADILAGAYVTNPLNLAVFGKDFGIALELNRRFFSAALENAFKGAMFVAERDDICGFLHFARSPSCLPEHGHASDEGERMSLLLGDAASMVREWFATWASFDPPDIHWHLGPIAVLPELQGSGIGRLLMERYCLEADRRAEPGYLETDRPENILFYEKFGFTVRGDVEIHGVKTWHMWRSPLAGT